MITRKQFNKWLKALRSGEYKRGKGQLEDDGLYCCLGVANDVCSLGVDSFESFVPGTFLPQALQDALAAANDGAAHKRDIVELFEKAGYATTPVLRVNKAFQYSAGFKSIANWLEANYKPEAA